MSLGSLAFFIKPVHPTPVVTNCHDYSHITCNTAVRTDIFNIFAPPPSVTLFLWNPHLAPTFYLTASEQAKISLEIKPNMMVQFHFLVACVVTMLHTTIKLYSAHTVSTGYTSSVTRPQLRNTEPFSKKTCTTLSSLISLTNA